MIMLAIFQVYSIACFATNAFGTYRLYMSSISADNLSKMFCNNLRRRPWFFVLPPSPNESIPKICPSQTILSLTNFIEHDHTNEDQIKKRPTGPLCKLNPCILSYLTITN